MIVMQVDLKHLTQQWPNDSSIHELLLAIAERLEVLAVFRGPIEMPNKEGK